MNKGSNNRSLPLGVIIAGGGSKRMGDQDKLLLPLDGKPMVERVVDRLRPQCDDIFLNLADESSADQFAIKVVPDDTKGTGPIGPIGGVYTALKLASSLGYSHLVTAPADVPFLPDDFVERLAVNDVADIAVANSAGRRHPVLALWNVSARKKVEAFIRCGDYKLMALLKALDVTDVAWADDPDPFFNINTPEDYAKAMERLKSA